MLFCTTSYNAVVVSLMPSCFCYSYLFLVLCPIFTSLSTQFPDGKHTNDSLNPKTTFKPSSGPLPQPPSSFFSGPRHISLSLCIAIVSLTFHLLFPLFPPSLSLLSSRSLSDVCPLGERLLADESSHSFAQPSIHPQTRLAVVQPHFRLPFTSSSELY